MNSKKYLKKLNKRSPYVSKRIAEVLNPLCDFLSVYSINNGGCCWVAYCLTKLLRNDGFKVDLVIDDSDGFIEDVNTLEEVEEACYHYFIRIGGFYINSGDSCNSDYLVVFPDITEQEVLEHYKTNDWCCAYDHSNNNIIYETLKLHYKKIINDLRKE